MKEEWVEKKIDLPKATSKMLQQFVYDINEAIRFLENHHYDTSKLIASTKKILGSDK